MREEGEWRTRSIFRLSLGCGVLIPSRQDVGGDKQIDLGGTRLSLGPRGGCHDLKGTSSNTQLEKPVC